MRPDAVNWSNTNGLSTLEFSPRQLVYRQLTRWAMRVAILQAVLAAALSVALLLAAARLDGAPARGVAVKGNAAPLSVKALLRSPAFAMVLAAQVSALVIGHVILLSKIRSTLRGHTRGLKELFEAIRSMAGGVVPKPLSAGAPGEAGYLALAFNDMTTRLLAGRRALVEANEMLERRVKERTAELQDANEKLEKMASTDALTGLANRRALMQRGEILFNASMNNDSDLAVFLIDLDHFKSVNDTLGHKKGDELISLAANVLRDACRNDDMTARLGGDEFTVLMPTHRLEMVTAKAEEFQAEFRRQVKMQFEGQGLDALPSMSIGITSRRCAGAATFAKLVQRADVALYRAKDLGRNRAEVYSPGLLAKVA